MQHELQGAKFGGFVPSLESERISAPAAAEPDIDPFGHFSRVPIMERPGLYVDGGISQYSFEFTEPVREFLGQRHSDETVLEFVQRKEKETPGIVETVVFAGHSVPTRTVDDHSDGPTGPLAFLKHVRALGTRLRPAPSRP